MICITILWPNNVEQYMDITIEGLKMKLKNKIEEIRKEPKIKNMSTIEYAMNRTDKINRLEVYLDLLNQDVMNKPGYTIVDANDLIIKKIMKDHMLNFWPYTIINIE